MGKRPIFPHIWHLPKHHVIIFGWEKMQSEEAAAFQVHNGLISSDAKSDICQRHPGQGRGHARGGSLLFVEALASLASLRLRQFGVLQKISSCGPWCGLELTQKWRPEVDGVCWQLKPCLELLPNHYHGDVCTREREPGRDLPRPLNS